MKMAFQRSWPIHYIHHVVKACVLATALLSAPLLFAQDWALINPAYRYNYNNDGTDTIRHQIRVMQVDTLGVDSFRFELNKVAVVCDECPAIGNSCAGCFVRGNQPQFLGFECVQSGTDWYFFGTDTFMIRGDATIGVSWIFDDHNGITATVDDEWEEDLFGSPDNVRRILLSSNDTILLSQSFGILRFAIGTHNIDLIGVEGAGVGRLFPDLLSYFDFDAGDELIYNFTYTCWHGSSNGPQYPGTCSYAKKIRITNRTEFPDSVVYTTSVALGYFSLNGGLGSMAVPQWSMPLNRWVFSRERVASDHPILIAYPGQLLDTTFCDSNWFSSASYVARHGLTSDGRNRIFSSWNGNSCGNSYYGILTGSAISADLYPASNDHYVWVDYEERMGLRLVQRMLAPSASGVRLIGAVIAGDTLLHPPAINWTVGLEEYARDRLMIHPNPADQTVFISGYRRGERITLFDLEGRLALTQRIVSTIETIDVQHLAPGVYLLAVDNMAPKRLVIAR